jgi:hypothetical protein
VKTKEGGPARIKASDLSPETLAKIEAAAGQHTTPIPDDTTPPKDSSTGPDAGSSNASKYSVTQPQSWPAALFLMVGSGLVLWLLISKGTANETRATAIGQALGWLKMPTTKKAAKAK